MDVIAPIFMGLYLSLIGLLTFYGLHRYWILYLYYRHYKWAKQPTAVVLTGQFPLVTVQLPVFNERYVVERLLDSVARLDYPQDRLEIQVLDDSTDDTHLIAAEKVRQMREQGFKVSHLHRQDRVGYKAGALAAGLEKARGTFIAIFDADFLPPENFLQKTVPWFDDPEIGMVQTRWGHLNEDYSLLTSLQSIFLDAHFLLEHTARNRSGAFFNFNGTAGIWRRHTIEHSGGWQADTLTEDLDLSYRAQMKGWKFMFLPEVVCPAELPVDIHAFKTQQNRWTMGAIQTARKMLPTIWRSDVPFKVKVEATFHLTGCVGYVLMALLSIMLPMSMYFRTHSQWMLTGWLEAFALFGTVLSVGLFYVACLRDLYPDWKSRTWNLPLMISLGVGMCLSNSRAIFVGLLRSRHEFRRTPKFSVVSRDRSWRRKQYRNEKPFKAYMELLFAVYFFIGFGVALSLRQWISLPFIMLFGFGYGYVAFLSAIHSSGLRWFPLRWRMTPEA